MATYADTLKALKILDTLGVSLAELEVACHVERLLDDEYTIPDVEEAFIRACEAISHDKGAQYHWEGQRDEIYDALEDDGLMTREESDE